MRKSLLILMVLCAASALAMPTKDELSKAQPLVMELMADDVTAYKAKSKKPEEIGDTSAKYAQEASTEAAKFLLLKGAISYYVRGESYDKAADAVNALRTEIADVPPAVVEEIIRKNTARVTAKKAPRLYAIYQTVQVQVEAAKVVRSAKAALAKKPKDEAAIRKLAEAQALLGDWKSSLDTFAKLGSKAGAMAKSETDGKNLPAVADFWWDYESYLGEEDADAFKIHAAAIYRQCLADGSIAGLKKNIVEKRLKQVGVVAGVSVVSAKPEASDIESSKKIVQKVAKQGKTLKLRIKTGVEIEFIECPKGSFMMGKSGDNRVSSCTRSHKVTFTRPFWISKTQITRAQWEAFEKPCVGDFYKRGADVADLPVSFVSYEMANDYCSHLNRRFKSQLPSGCIIRLPSDAEWEYALTAGTDDFNSPYIMFRDGSSGEQAEVGPKIAATKDDIKREISPLASDDLKKKYEANGDASNWLRNRVGKKLPNNWGLYDMLGNGAEIVLDTVYQPTDWANLIMPVDTRGRIQYQDEETDPLRIDEHPRKFGSVCITRGAAKEDKFSPDWYCRDGVPLNIGQNGQTFRLVIGPDLVSEWKAKNAKK